MSYEAISGGIFQSSYLLEPGAHVGQIRLRYNAPVEIEAGGDLRIGFESGWMTESAPVAWQEIGGQKIPVMVAFSLYDSSIENAMVGFSLDRYNPAYPVMIDPTLGPRKKRVVLDCAGFRPGCKALRVGNIGHIHDSEQHSSRVERQAR
jgi:hypothetical protein